MLVPLPSSLDFTWGTYLTGTLDLMTASQEVPGNGINEHPPLFLTAMLHTPSPAGTVMMDGFSVEYIYEK